jgi:hypothetical protein
LDSLRLISERDKQLLAVSQQQLAQLRSMLQEAEFLGDSMKALRLRDEERLKADSVATFERQIAAADANVQTSAVLATELRARQNLADQALSRSGYNEWIERQSRLMVSRLGRELKKIADGEKITLQVLVSGSPRTFEISGTGLESEFVYSPLALAILVFGSAAAFGMTKLSGEASEAVAVISSSKAFESRHIVWQRDLSTAASSANDPQSRKLLDECSEAARYASRDPVAEGVATNSEIDAVVRSLCSSPSPTEHELSNLASTLKSLIVRRENQVKEYLANSANKKKITEVFE